MFSIIRGFQIMDQVFHCNYESFSLLLDNQQVSTRFLSASPPLYWFASHLLISRGTGKRWGCMIWTYSTAYILLGSLLFSNFYPFTWNLNGPFLFSKMQASPVLLLVDCFHFTWPLDCLDAKPRWNGSARNHQSCCWKCQFQSSWGSFSAFLVKPCSEIHDSRVVLNRALAWVFNIFCGWEQPFAL